MDIRDHFKNLTSEGEQATIRASFIGLILTYLVLHEASDLAIYTCGSFFLLSSAFLIWIERTRGKNELRQWLTLVFDISMTTWGLAITGEYGAIFVFVYLWLIIGYGLRYGKKFTRGAYILCLAGFVTGIYVSQFWSTNYHLAVGYALMITLIPIHTMRLQGKYDKALIDANQASRAKSEFLSNMSHDLRTPLGGIVNGVELMEDSSPTLEQEKILYHVKHSVSVLKELIGDILDISKIEAGKIEITKNPTSLKSLIEEVNASFEHEVSKKGLAFNIISNFSVDYLDIDSKHLKQIIFNILSNAIKFTEKGTVTFTIDQISENDHLATYRFTIEDTGIGMSDKFINDIFDKFERDESTNHHYEGSGLGTSIANSLVGLMGGSINVESSINVGSTFTFDLSFDKAKERRILPRDAVSSNTITKINQANPSKKYNILIADDNTTNRFLLNAILSKVAAYNVIEAKDGNEALDMLEKESVDLMMLDLNMPGHDGLEIIKLQKQLNPLEHIPAIIITADASLSTRLECESGGADGVYTKPYEKDKILSLADDLLTKPLHKNQDLISDDEVFNNVPIDVNLIDYARVEELKKLGNDDGFITNILASSLGEISIFLTSMKDAAEKGDWIKYANYKHEMEGSCLNVGFDGIIHVLRNDSNDGGVDMHLLKLTEVVSETNDYVSENFQSLINIKVRGASLQ